MGQSLRVSIGALSRPGASNSFSFKGLTFTGSDGSLKQSFESVEFLLCMDELELKFTLLNVFNEDCISFLLATTGASTRT